ncbi:MAG: 30S ribosomal protein S9 [Candidatus Aenigmarchaeota archaeon]|nr:30S ribosomal protein S9 [Candidatus Aenigmarchaeota archaeon]
MAAKTQEKSVAEKRKQKKKADEKIKAVAAEKERTIAIGKRKRSVSQAVVKKGRGIVTINSIPLDIYSNEMARMKIKEALLLAGQEAGNFDIEVTVTGGGFMSQADAARQAIAKGLSGMVGDRLRKAYLSFDRSLIVADPRRTEPHKPSRSSKGPRRHKQRSKR